MHNRLKNLRHALLLLCAFAYMRTDGLSTTLEAFNPPICSEVCTSESDCSEECYENMMEYENGNNIMCGGYGTCEEEDPCESPSPVWQTVSYTLKSRFEEFYPVQQKCEVYEGWQRIQQDVQACVSARQPNQESCTWNLVATYYHPQEYACCVNYVCFTQACGDPW